MASGFVENGVASTPGEILRHAGERHTDKVDEARNALDFSRTTIQGADVLSTPDCLHHAFIPESETPRSRSDGPSRRQN